MLRRNAARRNRSAGLLTRQPAERVGNRGSGRDDRDDLAFGDDIVDRDQDGFQCSCRGRSDRNFHLHRFDEGDVLAVADFSAKLERKGADAPGNFCNDLDIWHANRLFVVAAQCLR